MQELTCAFCGTALTDVEANHFDDTVLCRDCLRNHTSICCCCDHRIWDEDNCGSDYTVLCETCRDEEYTNCDRCGRLIRNDEVYYIDDNEDIPYCHSCYEEMDDATIHNYGYKPVPIFRGDGPLYMGVELEIDKGGNYESNADELLSIANFQLENMYCKHDGSIEYGFEMVTHPMTLDYHKNEMPWKKIFEKAVSMNYRSHQTSTCGLHVHVNRSAFGDIEAQEDVISRIVYFVEAHWNELLKFSRRTEASINRWAARYGIAENAKLTYDKAKKSNYNRYVCVNLTNYDTIEFRIFRGTLRYETFMATLQLVHEICTKAIAMSDAEFEAMCWADFVKGINQEDKPELIRYLKSKQLYINEPTVNEEDDI